MMPAQPLTPATLMAKADTASSSARALLMLGDVDGAANRAYYAMFDAARAALLASNASVPPEIARTHSGLIGAFGLHLIKPGVIPRDLGRLLNQAYEIRQTADYSGEAVELEDAKVIVEKAEVFLAAIRTTFMPPQA